MNPLISTCLFAAFGCVLSMGHAIAAEPAETSPEGKMREIVRLLSSAEK